MGQLGSRLDPRARRVSRRSHSSAQSPPSVRDISAKDQRTPVVDSVRVQHVRTVGARRLSKEPWDERKYEWRAEGESWSSPDGAVTEDDSGEYENPISIIDLDRRLAESPVNIPPGDLNRRLAESPVSMPPDDYDRRLAETPVSTPPEDYDRELADTPVSMPPEDLVQRLADTPVSMPSEDLDRSHADPEWYSLSFGEDECDSPTGGKTKADRELDPASPTGDFDPQDFMDQVPQTDTEGVEIAPWKRIIIVRQMAEIARRKKEEQRLKEEEEATYYELPRWKRALIQKTEAKLREKQDRRLEDELSMKPKRTRDLSMLLDEDGLPIPDPLDDAISLTESFQDDSP